MPVRVQLCPHAAAQYGSSCRSTWGSAIRCGLRLSPAQYPSLLGFPAPEVLAYPREAVIAEKLEAMIVFGDRNSRIKDFFDLHYLASRFEFDRATLAEAIRRTFERRRTPIPREAPIGLTPLYWQNPSRPAQIRAFARRAGLEVPVRTGRASLLACSLRSCCRFSMVCGEAQMGKAHGRPGDRGRIRHERSDSPRTRPSSAALQAVPGLQGLRRRMARGDSSALGGEAAPFYRNQRARTASGGMNPTVSTDIACVRVADFDRLTFRVDIADPTLRSIEPRLAAARALHRGDLLLEKSGGGENQPVGAVVLYDHGIPAVCSSFVARVTVAAGFDARFLTYLHAALYSLRINTRHIKQSTGIQNLDSASYLGEATGLPPEPEQRAIAAFLDRETARIDALVAKKERLIELLQEKRDRPHHPRRHQGPQPERSHEGLRRRVAGRDSSALGNEAAVASDSVPSPHHVRHRPPRAER